MDRFNERTKVNIFKNISVYFVSQVITALLPIIIIPIVSRTLSLNDFGNYSLYKGIFGFLIPIVGLSFSSAVVRKYYMIERSIFLSYLLTLMVVVSGAGMCLWIVMLVNMDYLLKFLKTNDSYIVLYSLYLAYLTSISYILLGYYRITNDLRRYLISNIIIIFLSIFGVLILDFYHVLTLFNLMNVHLAAISLSVIYNIIDFFNRSRSKLSLDFYYLKDTFNYSLPLVLYSVLAQFYASGDRFFINYFLDKESLAVYSAGSQMAFAIPLIGQSIQLAWTPVVFEEMTRSDSQKKLKRMIFVFWIVLIFFTIIYILVYPYIFQHFLPRKFDSVLQFFYLFIIAGFFQSLYWLYNPFLLFYERNSIFVYITLIGASVSLTLNYCFAERGLFWIASIFAFSWFVQFLSLLIAIKYVKNLKKDLQHLSYIA